MGFGTLFIGYFLLLNITYYGFTDIIAALIMLMGLIKLSPINRYFKTSVYVGSGFCVFSVWELGLFAWQLFTPSADFSQIYSYSSIVRNAILCVFTIALLKGIQDVTKEVKLPNLALRSQRMTYVVFVIYLLSMLLNTTVFFEAIPSVIPTYLSVFVILGTLVMMCIILATIYSCYSKICMPGSQNKGSTNIKKR